MKQEEDKFKPYLKNFVRDLLFLGPLFLIMFFILRESVPSFSAFWVNFFGVLSALCVASVGWLVLQMFKVVLFDQRARAKENATK
ncbi:MAG: hypothetical protein WD490_00340 [Opitutales bacterium]